MGDYQSAGRDVISQEGGSGPNIAQTGERSIAQTGAQSSVQVQQGAPAAVEAQPKIARTGGGNLLLGLWCWC